MSIFGSLTKAAIGVVVETPLALVADIITMGGALTDKDEPYAVSAVKNVVSNVEKATRDE
jgi:predicted MPP superfamily phosphohydrolase